MIKTLKNTVNLSWFRLQKANTLCQVHLRRHLRDGSSRDGAVLALCMLQFSHCQWRKNCYCFSKRLSRDTAWAVKRYSSIPHDIIPAAVYASLLTGQSKHLHQLCIRLHDRHYRCWFLRCAVNTWWLTLRNFQWLHYRRTHCMAWHHCPPRELCTFRSSIEVEGVAATPYICLFKLFWCTFKFAEFFIFAEFFSSSFNSHCTVGTKPWRARDYLTLEGSVSWDCYDKPAMSTNRVKLPLSQTYIP